jgi:TRAP-type C4-dicarboxylate transport system substrate-binding protein
VDDVIYKDSVDTKILRKGVSKMKKLLILPIIIILLFALIFNGCAAQSTGIVLKLVTFLPPQATVVKPVGMYIDMLNEKAAGKLMIDWVGGPDIIPRRDQGSAVMDGAIDMAALPASYYQSAVPAGFAICILSEATPMEEHENGAYDLLVEVNERAGIRLIGRTETNMSFHMGIKQAVSTPQELAGNKIRSMGLYNFFLEALGCSPVQIPHPEVYTALERGLVDGYCFPFSDVNDLSLYEVCDNFIDHTFYESGNVVVIMNLDKWNSLPKSLQKLMLDTMIELEPQVYDIYGKDQAAAKQSMLDNGMNPIKFSAADAKWYRDLAFSSFKEGIKGVVDAETFARVLEVTGK